MPPHILHSGVEVEPGCDCENCSPSKKPRRAISGLTFVESPTESQPIVKGNNRYGAKGTIRCLACQRRKGKCEFPPDKPDQPCEHCKRRGHRCGEKLPTERKRQLNQSQDELAFVRTLDTSWSPTTSQPPYRYTEEPRQYSSYSNGAGPRPVAPALPVLDPRPSVNYNSRPYHPAPPNISRPPPPLFPQGADLVRLIESRIAKISLTETFALARCLSSEHGLVGNPYITGVTISRKNQEFSRGDSWFNVIWYENTMDHGPIPRSVNLRFEPGRQVCTSYPAEDVVQQQQQLQLQQQLQQQQQQNLHHQQHHHHRHSQSHQRLPIAPRQEAPPPPIVQRESVGSPMDVDPPKGLTDWSGLVGDLFDKAAGIRDKATSEERSPSRSPEQPSTALWPLKFWNAVKTTIWGHQLSKSEYVYTFGTPNATIGVVVERCRSIVDVFWSSKETEPANCQQFIEHAEVKKKVSLKTLAKVLSRLSALKAKKTAAESIQVVEEIVNTETAVEQLPSSPRKRRFEEIHNDQLVPVKSERSMSAGSNISGTTNTASMGDVKMEDEPTTTVDEETSNAASILNDVAMDRRTIDNRPAAPMTSYSTPFWQQVQPSPRLSHGQGDLRKSQVHPNNGPWLHSHNYASQETFR